MTEITIGSFPAGGNAVDCDDRPVETTRLEPDKKLKILQRLDPFRPWQNTHQRRLCLGCGKIISGLEIRLIRSLWGLGLLQLRCPTEDCKAGPVDWVDPQSRI